MGVSDICCRGVDVLVAETESELLGHLVPLLLDCVDGGCECGFIKLDCADQVWGSVVSLVALVWFCDEGEVVDVVLVDPRPSRLRKCERLLVAELENNGLSGGTTLDGLHALGKVLNGEDELIFRGSRECEVCNIDVVSSCRDVNTLMD
jgi:hypothetical protein